MRLDVVEQVEVMDCEWSTGYIYYVHPYIMQHLPIGIVKLGTTTPEESGQVSSLIHTVRKPAFSCLLSRPAFTHLVRVWIIPGRGNNQWENYGRDQIKHGNFICDVLSFSLYAAPLYVVVVII